VVGFAWAKADPGFADLRFPEQPNLGRAQVGRATMYAWDSPPRHREFQT
jgi:hypothetical protein